MTDNHQKTGYWLKQRRFGAGATPVVWQGWAMIAGFPVICGVLVLALFALLPPVVSVILLVVLLPTAIFAFITVARKKTDGPWCSRWGDNSRVKSE